MQLLQAMTSAYVLAAMLISVQGDDFQTSGYTMHKHCFAPCFLVAGPMLDDNPATKHFQTCWMTIIPRIGNKVLLTCLGLHTPKCNHDSSLSKLLLLLLLILYYYIIL